MLYTSACPAMPTANSFIKHLLYLGTRSVSIFTQGAGLSKHFPRYLALSKGEGFALNRFCKNISL